MVAAVLTAPSRERLNGRYPLFVVIYMNNDGDAHRGACTPRPPFRGERTSSCFQYRRILGKSRVLPFVASLQSHLRSTVPRPPTMYQRHVLFTSTELKGSREVFCNKTIRQPPYVQIAATSDASGRKNLSN